MFRVHGTGAGKEFWQFDQPTQKTLRNFERLRYRLMPYIYSVSVIKNA
jgi:alpha-D-xyloside xylohydrolase